MTYQDGVPFLDLREQHRLLRSELMEAMEPVISSAAFIRGSDVAQFEHEFAQYIDTSTCVSVGNGTDALEIGLESLDLPLGSEVIVPANSFIATSEAVTRSGLRVVFADVDDTYTLDPASVEEKITSRTSAVVAVHLYGQPAQMSTLQGLCQNRGLQLVEDAAQAHGADSKGVRVGAIGTIGAFSFFPGKNLGAMGDAGAITTADPDLAERCRRIANHGRWGKFDHSLEGRNSRMDSLQAAVLRVKLRHLDSWLSVRRETASIYRRGLNAAFPGMAQMAFEEWSQPCRPGEIRLSREVLDDNHAYHLFVVRVPRRDAVRRALGEFGIETGIHYPTALPHLAAYAGHPQRSDAFRCGAWADELVSLPMGDHMTPERAQFVVEALVEVLRRSALR